MYNDTIVALATASGAGAIAIIRISGKDAIQIGDSAFRSIKNKDLTTQKTHTLHLGHIVDGEKTLVDACISGDEAAMYAQQLNVPIVVGKNRLLYVHCRALLVSQQLGRNSRESRP